MHLIRYISPWWKVASCNSNEFTMIDAVAIINAVPGNIFFNLCFTEKKKLLYTPLFIFKLFYHAEKRQWCSIARIYYWPQHDSYDKICLPLLSLTLCMVTLINKNGLTFQTQREPDITITFYPFWINHDHRKTNNIFLLVTFALCMIGA